MLIAGSRNTLVSSAFFRSPALSQRRTFTRLSCHGSLPSRIHKPVIRRLPPFRRVYTSQANLSSSTPHPGPQGVTPTLPKRSFLRRAARFLAFALFYTSVGFVMATAPVASTANGLIHPPTDAESLDLYTPPTPEAASINALILSHPLSQSLRADPKFTESRPHMKIPLQARPNNLTGGTLLGEDKVVVPPLVFVEEGGKSLISLQYLGSALCGHPGIVHGGLLATLLDEGLARCCFPALPSKVGVTASLNIEYKKLCQAGQVVVLRAQTTKVEGRKAWVEGRIETLGEIGSEEEEVGGLMVRKVGDGEVLCSAEALFIEPKFAATMPRVYSTQGQ